MDIWPPHRTLHANTSRLNRWDKATSDASEEDMLAEGFWSSAGEVGRDKEKPKDRKSIGQQAKAMLSGKEKWRPTWQDLGKEVDVERKDWSGTKGGTD
jgi:hypothetical protein